MWMCDVNDVMVCFSALWLVSSFTNNLSSMPTLDNGDNGLLSSAPPGDDDKCTGSSRETLRCYICGAWLRGRRTLNEHFRGGYLSIYNYHKPSLRSAAGWLVLATVDMAQRGSRHPSSSRHSTVMWPRR